MIDPKYADLPGIAYDQPDIYETDDRVDNESEDLPPDDGESVEKFYINATDAYDKFKDKRISTRGVDFSDTISKKKLGYNVSSGEWELTCRNEDETPFQKYRRLKHECEEFMNEINVLKDNVKKTEEAKSLSEIMHQIDNTTKELDSMNIDKLLSGNSINTLHNHQEIRLKELQSQIELFKQKDMDVSEPKKPPSAPTTDSKAGTITYQMVYYPDKAKVQDVARLSHLEKRLGYLESVIGVSTDNTTKASQVLRSQGITKSIEKLMANACLLSSTQLDIVENKVTSLLHKMDSVSQKKAQTAQDTKYEKQISELYDLVKQFENCSETLPQIIDRMVALSGLHKKAAEFTTQLKELQDLEQNISGSLTNNRQILEEMQKNFSGNLEIIGKDIASLSERVKKLQK